MRVVVVGAGSHSRMNHLPALRDIRHRVEGTVESSDLELAAICDLDQDLARSAREEFGFQRSYQDWQIMLQRERPDGCVAVTPQNRTAHLVPEIARTGVPLLMEKPLGLTIAEAEAVCGALSGLPSPVMVSMNRRFDPALRQAADWLGDRTVDHLGARMLRHARDQEDFIFETAIHSIDALIHLGGPARADYWDHLRTGGVRSLVARLEFSSGALGLLEVFPATGCVEEEYEVRGPGYRILCSVGEKGTGRVRAWEEGRLVLDDHPARGSAAYVANGTVAETLAFLEAVAERRPFSPSPEDALAGARLAAELSEPMPSGRAG